MGQRKSRFSKTALFGALAALLLAGQAFAFQPFVIRSIKAEGLQRLDLGTVLTYLPLSVGDELNDATASQAIRSLYGTGLFQDVQLERDGDALVIVVKERPAITSFSLKGNEKIGGDELKKSLKDLGLADGELYKRELLDQVEQELRRQYYANGYYDVAIDTTVTNEPNNRVSLKIQVTEGKPTKIKSINIVGNKVYSDKELLAQFKLEPTNWVPFQKSDRYSKQELNGDLETLQSYYQDRGYLKFAINSVQVALTPDKTAIYITINVDEGTSYTVKNHKFSGETILNQDYLNALVSTPDGSTFSRKEATDSANRIEGALSDIGYAFAKVTPVPEVDEDNKQVSINYYVEPGKRVYVRHIIFNGYGTTNDETLRREMRQLEAAPFSKSAVERSRVRLTRLAFIQDADVDTRPVPGTDDQVDIVFTIKERPPGSVQFGVGYSGSEGFLISGSLTHTNFLGTGDTVNLSLDHNAVSKSVNLAWTNPYFTEDGISQTVSLFYRKSSALVRYASSFNANMFGGGLTYGIPLSEYTSLRAGFAVQQTAIETFPLSTSDEVEQFVVENGSRFTTFKLQTGISRDTRNRTFFANYGSLYQLNFDFTVPGSELRYYSLSYRGQQYVPLFYKFFLEANTSIGYVDTYGGTSSVPPYENYFAGGPQTVRGYTDGTLGPLDTPFRNPFGGKLRTTAQMNFVVPMPFLPTDGKSTRAEMFFDIGNVFAQPDQFAFGDLRQSAGVAFSWFTPFLGLLDLSYAFPLNPQTHDRTERFQISFGTGFN
ncbi:MAG TPA: outer membrane protein assembly factor BamA [Stenotrophobium sp.]|jgi:outer membrane protein insertion porin family|nr:outer membrane protein assembly factor BamA [Stenotrophobium sp.]